MIKVKLYAKSIYNLFHTAFYNRNIKYIILILLFILSITGCTAKDSVEINKREYIFAVGIDSTKQNIESSKNNSYFTRKSSKDFLKSESENYESQYTFTAEVPIISTGSEDKRYIMTQNSANLTAFYYDNIFSTEKIASDSLMQVIVIGADVAKNQNSIKRLFDEIERSPQINRKVKLVVAKNKASDIINFEIKDNPLIGRYISEFLIKLKKLSFLTTYSFDEAALYLQGLGSALIPSVEIKNGRISIDGAAIIKDYRLVDYIDYSENAILSMLTSGAASGLNEINVFVDEEPVTLTVDNVTVSQKIDLNEDKLSAEYYVTAACSISAYDMTKQNSSDSDFISKLSIEAKNSLNAQTESLIEKMQKNYQMDIFKIREDLIKYKNVEYNKIKDKYDEIFKNANIKVNYNIKINNSGMVR